MCPSHRIDFFFFFFKQIAVLERLQHHFQAPRILHCLGFHCFFQSVVIINKDASHHNDQYQSIQRHNLDVLFITDLRNKRHQPILASTMEMENWALKSASHATEELVIQLKLCSLCHAVLEQKLRFYPVITSDQQGGSFRAKSFPTFGVAA